MKFQILKENLVRSLSFVSRIISSKSQIPILSNVLIKTDNGRIRFSATNLETGIHFWAGAKVEKEGEVTTPAKYLTDFANILPNEKVEMELIEETLRVTCLNSSSLFNTVSSKEFPEIPTIKGEAALSLPLNFFQEALDKVIYAVSQDEGRPVLTGVLFEFFSKEVSLVATDGFRLSWVKQQRPKGSTRGEGVKFLVPGRTLIEVLRAMEEFKEEKTVSLFQMPNSNQVIFTLGDIQIVTQLIGGEYPNYQKIIPKEAGVQFWVEKESFLKAVKTASIFARESANVVKIKIGGGKISVSANTPQIGSNITTIDCKGEGEGEIAFNARYLLDFLNSYKEEEFVWEYRGALSPGVFKAPKKDDFMHMIMPVRLQN